MTDWWLSMTDCASRTPHNRSWTTTLQTTQTRLRGARVRRTGSGQELAGDVLQHC